MDLTESIAPRSDQVNADDLIAGPITYTIREVITGKAESPFDFLLVETDRAYRPSKTMRRVIVNAWGPEASNYAGRRLTLYREPSITFGREVVGGIRISAMSHIDGTKKVKAQVTRGKREEFTVEPLPDAPAPADPHQERIQAMLAAYASGGITHAMLEAHQGRAVSEWDEGNVANLAALFEALKSGAKKKADEFPELDAAAETGADA